MSPRRRHEGCTARPGPRQRRNLPNDLTNDTALPLKWWPRKTLVLSPKQLDIISLLIGPEGSITKLKKYSELKQEEAALFMENELHKGIEYEAYEASFEEHLENVAEAIRAGLIWHPLVSEFIYTYKALGNKEILRAIKRGWETGVKRPIKIKDIRFMLHLDRIVEYRNKGKTLIELRRDLMKRKIIEKITWQSLEKKVKKAWRIRWEKVGKEPPPIR